MKLEMDFELFCKINITLSKSKKFLKIASARAVKEVEFPVKFGTFCSRLRLKITKIFLSNMAFLTSEECSSVCSKPRKIIKKEIVSRIFNFEKLFLNCAQARAFNV